MSGSARTTLISISSIPLSRGALHFGKERSSNGSCRSHRALGGLNSALVLRPFSFSSLVSPLRPLGLGLLSRCDPRAFIYFYDVTDAGLASHRVRLWQGGPASTYCRFRLLVLLLTGTCFPGVCLLALPEVRKGPWPLRRPREMAMAVASSARLACFVVQSAPVVRRTPDTFPFWSLCSDGPLSSRPQPLEWRRRRSL